MPLDFDVTRGPAFHEFRVRNISSSRLWPWWSFCILAVILAARHTKWMHSLLVLFILVFWKKLGKHISESIIVYPCHGIQLEMRSGFERRPIVTRRFIPFSMIRDVVINEGLYGWNVRYYLAIMIEDQFGHQEIQVAFEVSQVQHPKSY